MSLLSSLLNYLNIFAAYNFDVIFLVIDVIDIVYSLIFSLLFQPGPHILSRTGHLTGNDIQWVREHPIKSSSKFIILLNENITKCFTAVKNINLYCHLCADLFF